MVESLSYTATSATTGIVSNQQVNGSLRGDLPVMAVVESMVNLEFERKHYAINVGSGFSRGLICVWYSVVRLNSAESTTAAKPCSSPAIPSIRNGRKAIPTGEAGITPRRIQLLTWTFTIGAMPFFFDQTWRSRYRVGRMPYNGSHKG